jgi:hypothetical protein
MNVCGAKTRSGGRCKRPGAANGRCRLHGGAPGSGRPPEHGRRSQYARIFGQDYARLLRDPDILKSDGELALFDLFLLERADLLRHGFSAAWLDDVKTALAALNTALFEKRDAQAVRQAFQRLESQITAGGERVGAWEELLEAAGQRSNLASKAAAALAKQESSVSENKLVVMFGQMLDILTDVAGADTARKVADRFERDVLGRVAASAAGAGIPNGVN